MVNLAWAAMVVRRVPFGRLAASLGTVEAASPPNSGDGTSEGDPRQTSGGEQVAAALRRGASLLPWPCACLVQAVAGVWMLRRRKLPCALHLGVNPLGGHLQAHAWLLCGAQTVCGERGVEEYVEISRIVWQPSAPMAKGKR